MIVLTYKEYMDNQFLTERPRVICQFTCLYNGWLNILEDLPHVLKYLYTVNSIKDKASF